MHLVIERELLRPLVHDPRIAPHCHETCPNGGALTAQCGDGDLSRCNGSGGAGSNNPVRCTQRGIWGHGDLRDQRGTREAIPPSQDQRGIWNHGDCRGHGDLRDQRGTREAIPPSWDQWGIWDQRMPAQCAAQCSCRLNACLCVFLSMYCKIYKASLTIIPSHVCPSRVNAVLPRPQCNILQRSCRKRAHPTSYPSPHSPVAVPRQHRAASPTMQPLSVSKYLEVRGSKSTPDDIPRFPDRSDIIAVDESDSKRAGAHLFKEERSTAQIQQNQGVALKPCTSNWFSVGL